MLQNISTKGINHYPYWWMRYWELWRNNPITFTKLHLKSLFNCSSCKSSIRIWCTQCHPSPPHGGRKPPSPAFCEPKPAPRLLITVSHRFSPVFNVKTEKKTINHSQITFTNLFLNCVYWTSVQVQVLTCVVLPAVLKSSSTGQKKLWYRFSWADRAQVTVMHYLWERKGRLDIKRTLTYSQVHEQLNGTIMYWCWCNIK